MDFEKTLDALDFEHSGLPCNTRRMVWSPGNPQAPLRPEVEIAEMLGHCGEKSHTVYRLRLCPCWKPDARALFADGNDLSGVEFVGGLLVRAVVLCDAHVSFFRDHLDYPFLCPGCGLYYESADEVLLSERPI
ncbi:hypothetical protein QLT00_gp54 [Gordonia phage Commandaria]|uniref:Uncharacterized protein n=1 Tax=Gordonia phage Commandaria TaxID=3038364 RepID=A0AAF0GMJ9_9CAUD|nr:hypothetical protein QLT00_gp54 [Gordonia phage Commandaria]WGH20837.1 hypothetical protein [Gordonia phage Commandaria]